MTKTKELQPFNTKRRYSMDTLQRYWDALDNGSTIDYDVMGAYAERLAEMGYEDVGLAVNKLEQAIAALLTSYITRGTSEGIFSCKFNALFPVLRTPDIVSGLKESPTGLYCLVAYAMYHGVTADVSLVLLEDELSQDDYRLSDMLTTLTGEFFRIDPKHAKLPSEQIARILLAPAWCALVAPSINTCYGMMQAIWRDRPPLLNTQCLGSAETVQLVILPDSCAP